MPAILSRLPILIINYVSRDFDKTKIFLYNKLSAVVIPACGNAA